MFSQCYFVSGSKQETQKSTDWILIFLQELILNSTPTYLVVLIRF